MIAVLVAALVFPVHAHTGPELIEWANGWAHRADVALTPALRAEWVDMVDRHRWFFDPQPVTEPVAVSSMVVVSNGPDRPPTVYAGGVEQWRPLIAAYFAPEHVDRALAVLGCETGWTGDPGSYNGRFGAAGLFQFLPGTWDRVAVPLGYGNYSSGAVYDPAANIHAAAVLSNGGANWSQWSCRP